MHQWDTIYPKRIGIAKGRDALVIEYYSLAKDCFKKHAIPFNSSRDAKTIVKQILENPKHSIYLRKIDPKHIEAVINGLSIVSPSRSGQNGKILENTSFTETASLTESNIKLQTVSLEKKLTPVSVMRDADVTSKQKVEVQDQVDEYQQDFQKFEDLSAEPQYLKQSPSCVQQPTSRDVSATEISEESKLGKAKSKQKSKSKEKGKKGKSKQKKSKKSAQEPQSVRNRRPIEDQFQFL